MPDSPAPAPLEQLTAAARLLRYYSLLATTEAGSGHPTSCLSAADLMAALFFGGSFRADVQNPSNPHNDRLLFSKGHAAPLLYALYAVAGMVSENELRNLRRFGSMLEGHPTMRFPFTEAPTGSLGQGLSIGAGIALSAKYLEKTEARTFVLLGDSEMAEGSNWEALELAAKYRLDNLIGLIDLNRLGQRGETLLGHDAEAMAARVGAFGWGVTVVDGHDVAAVLAALRTAVASPVPHMIVAKTEKGHGVSAFADQPGWHGKALSQEEFAVATAELGEINRELRLQPPPPAQSGPLPPLETGPLADFHYEIGARIATRKAFGQALARLSRHNPRIIALDAEVSNSTCAQEIKAARPDRFLEMYVAEQNMVGMAVGLARRGWRPVVSTFAAFLSRAADQLRMAQYAEAPLVVVGSHAGVSIGEDGASQMGLEDIAHFRAMLGSTVFYPADAVAAERLLEDAVARPGVSYLRTTRMDLPVLYESGERFPSGSLKVLRQDPADVAVVFAAGVTLHEALAAHEALKKDGVLIRVIDLYSVKPLDEESVRKHARRSKFVVTVEDHFEAGGLGEAVSAALAAVGYQYPVHRLAVRKMPQSGKPAELLDYEEISRTAIVAKVKAVVEELGLSKSGRN